VTRVATVATQHRPPWDPLAEPAARGGISPGSGGGASLWKKIDCFATQRRRRLGHSESSLALSEAKRWATVF